MVESITTTAGGALESRETFHFSAGSIKRYVILVNSHFLIPYAKLQPIKRGCALSRWPIVLLSFGGFSIPIHHFHYHIHKHAHSIAAAAATSATCLPLVPRLIKARRSGCLCRSYLSFVSAAPEGENARKTREAKSAKWDHILLLLSGAQCCFFFLLSGHLFGGVRAFMFFAFFFCWLGVSKSKERSQDVTGWIELCGYVGGADWFDTTATIMRY